MKSFMLLAVCLLALAAAPLATAQERPALVEQPNGVLIGGSFMMVDQNGNTVSDAEFRGRPMLIYFGYTFCPDVCPPAMQSMSETLELLGDDAEKIQAVFVSVDPERDDPARLREYLTHFDPRITGLTGPRPMVEAMLDKYRVKAEKTSTWDDSYLMDHTSSMVLMGPQGEYVDRFGYGLPSEEIADRIRDYLSG